MNKIFAIVTLLAAANAVPVDHQASSFVSFNNNHNSVQHILSAPIGAKYSVPSPTSVYTPKLAVPVIPKVAPVPQYAAPVFAAPVPVAPVTKYATAPIYSAAKEEYAPAKYEFAYVIEDPHTGDYHSQQEQRDGDHVVGQYSLHEADGTIRFVKYSDDGHGFNAVVEKQGEPTPAPVYKKVVPVAAPGYFH